MHGGNVVKLLTSNNEEHTPGVFSLIHLSDQSTGR